MEIILLLSLALTLSSHPTLASLSSPDLLSLLAFKSAILDDTYHLLSNWNPASNHCTWYGVACDPVSLKIPNATIYGTLPPSISNLTHLKTLSIPHNFFSNPIPPDIGRMLTLETLELQGNSFFGQIPYEITRLSSLRVFNLLFGEIPDGLIGFGWVSALDLSNNYFLTEITGGKFGDCEFLNHLKLSGNTFFGSIPLHFGKCTRLRTLLLDANHFEGGIPVEVGRMSELRILDVSRNNLTNRIPSELGDCKLLSVVVLTNLA